MKPLPTPTVQERRAKREARREKQRKENVRRAEKMHAARMADPQIASAIDRLDPRQRFFVGCSGWFYWHWKGLFYPEDLPTSRWFPRYMDRFNTVELNAPFYSWPTLATVAAWLRQVGRKRFVYTVKVSELITHTKRFEGTSELVRDFGHIGDLLGRRMGCLLFQLPPSFDFTPTKLENILSQLEPQRRNVVEFRHRSWWNADVYAAFRERGAIFCSVSGPRLPNELVKTADEIYVRFHGTKRWYRHDYSKEELQIWANRIIESGVKRVWAYFNNDRDGYAIKNARTLLRMLKATSYDESS